PDLRRRRLRAEDGLVVEEEARERRARRMTGREVEAVEVVVRQLNLASVDDGVAEPEEDVLHLPPDLRDQVEATAPVAPDRQSHVDPLGRQPLVELRPREIRLTRVDRLLEPLPHGVEGHPGLAIAHLAEGLFDRALAPQVLDANGL